MEDLLSEGIANIILKIYDEIPKCNCSEYVNYKIEKELIEIKDSIKVLLSKLN